MKGQAGGGITIFNVLLFYSIFLFFVAFIGTMAGVAIVTVGGNPSNIPIPSFNPLDILGSVVSLFNFFVAFLSTNTTFQLLAIVLVTPFLIILGYALLQLIRGTG
jgi:hypothetical protein